MELFLYALDETKESWQKIQQKVVRELEKNFSDYEKYLAKTDP